MIKKFIIKKVGLFVGGALFGSLGIKALSSKDAKKQYVNITAAALRAKDYILKSTETFRENCEDIYEAAKDVNEARAIKDAEEEKEIKIFEEVTDK